MKEDRMATLKQKLLTATEFTDILNYFFDHFGENREFMARGEPVQGHLLEALIRVTARNLMGEKARVSRMLLIRLPEHGFVHGPVVVDGQMGNVLYFEDVRMGLMSIVVSATGETRMARITAVPASMKPND